MRSWAVKWAIRQCKGGKPDTLVFFCFGQIKTEKQKLFTGKNWNNSNSHLFCIYGRYIYNSSSGKIFFYLTVKPHQPSELWNYFLYLTALGFKQLPAKFKCCAMSSNHGNCFPSSLQTIMDCKTSICRWFGNKKIFRGHAPDHLLSVIASKKPLRSFYNIWAIREQQMRNLKWESLTKCNRLPVSSEVF